MPISADRRGHRVATITNRFGRVCDAAGPSSIQPERFRACLMNLWIGLRAARWACRQQVNKTCESRLRFRHAGQARSSSPMWRQPDPQVSWRFSPSAGIPGSRRVIIQHPLNAAALSGWRLCYVPAYRGLLTTDLRLDLLPSCHRLVRSSRSSFGARRRLRLCVCFPV
jgi:hypothetical protein